MAKRSFGSGKVKKLDPKQKQAVSGLLQQVAAKASQPQMPPTAPPAMPPQPAMKRGGGVKCYAKGGGVEIKGKTKGKFR